MRVTTLLHHQYDLSLVPSQCEMYRTFWAEPVAVFRETFDEAVVGWQKVEPALAELTELSSTSGIGTVGDHRSLQGIRPQRAGDPPREAGAGGLRTNEKHCVRKGL
jgi:hypothetical protein